jgi:hypothetical protein
MAVRANLGKASIAIRATLDKLDGDLADAKRKTTGVVGKITQAAGRGFQALGTAAMVGLAAATVAVVGLALGLGKIIKTSTLSAARVSEMNAVLQHLGKSAGWSTSEVEDNVEAMREVGIRTDVAQGMLAQFARNQLKAAEATKVARVAQDLAVLSGRDSSEALAELNYAIQTQNSDLQVFRDLGIQAGDALSTYADELGVTTGELDKSQRMQAMINAVMERGAAVSGVYATAMEEPGKAMRSLSRHFYEAGLEIGKHFLPAFGDVIDLVGKGIKAIRGMLEEGEILNEIFSTMGETAESVTGFLGTFFDLILAGQDPLDSFSLALWKAFGSDALPVIGFINTLKETVGGLVSAFSSLAAGDFEGFTVQIADTFGNLWEKVQPKLTSFFTNVQGWVQSVDWEEIGRSIIEWITAGFVFLQEDVMPKVQTFFQDLRSWFQGIDWQQVGYDVTASILEGIMTLYDEAQSWFGSVDWASLGMDILRGIARGLADWSIVRDAITDLASGALQAGRDALVAHSPSKEAEKLFYSVPQGAALALRNGMGLVENAADSMTNQALTGAQNQVQKQWFGDVHLQVGSVEEARAAVDTYRFDRAWGTT